MSELLPELQKNQENESIVILPKSWLLVNLGAIVKYEETKKIEPNEIPKNAWVLELEDIEKDSSKLLMRVRASERKSKSTKHVFKTGDILYSRLRPYLSKVIMADIDGFCTTEIIPLKAHEYLDARYLFYWLKSPMFLNYVDRVSRGVNMPRLTTQAGIAAPFVLAPLNEQKRIVEALEHQLRQINSSLEQLDESLQQSANFPRSIFNAAIQGDLTRDWRKERNIDKTSWTEKRGSEVFSFITSGSRGWADYYASSGALFLRISNVQHNSIEPDLEDLIYVKLPEEIEGKRTRIHVGDILISITADIGRIAFIKQDLGEAYINQHLCLARLNDEYQHMGEYLAYFLAAQEGGQKQFEELRRGATRAGLGLADIRNLKFLFPTHEEQLEIIRCVEEQYGFAKQLQTQYKETQAKLRQTIPKLLEKAFRGELVPQDPTDDPASVLLERIRAAREEAANKPKEVKIRKPPMKKITPEVVAQAISDMPNDHFSFDDIKELIPTDYDTLRNCLFSLLSDAKLNQVFDQNTESMRFERARP